MFLVPGTSDDEHQVTVAPATQRQLFSEEVWLYNAQKFSKGE